MNLKKFFVELKRRSVYKVAVSYGVTAWLLAQIVALASETIGAPDWVMRMIFIVLIIGFPLALILAWAFEMSPKGFIRTSSITAKENPYPNKQKKPFTGNIFIGILVLIIIGQFTYTKFYSASFDPTDIEKSIAVLPFENMSAGEDNEWFSDGVTEDILTHLAKIKELRVISRTSVKQYKGSDKTIPEIAKELGVSYIVEGSVRQQNNKVLITVQLISANDEHIWAENYDENLDNAFEIPRNVSNEIVKQLRINLKPAEE